MKCALYPWEKYEGCHCYVRDRLLRQNSKIEAKQRKTLARPVWYENIPVLLVEEGDWEYLFLRSELLLPL